MKLIETLIVSLKPYRTLLLLSAAALMTYAELVALTAACGGS